MGRHTGGPGLEPERRVTASNLEDLGVSGFSEELMAEAQPIWERIFSHPFLREIKDGTLPLEKFQYYLGQDYLYLEGFGRTVAMTLAKSPDSALMEELSQRVLTPIERPLHHKLVSEAGLTMEDVKKVQRSPTNTGYVNHMLVTASLHGLGPAAASLLPCPWTYHLLRERIGAVGAPSVQPVDRLLCSRSVGKQRASLAKFCRPDGGIGRRSGIGGDAAGFFDQQPVRVHVLGNGLQHGAMAGLMMRPKEPLMAGTVPGNWGLERCRARI